MQGQARRGFALIVVTGILWGTIGIAAKLVQDHSDLDSFSVTWLRTLIASPVVVLLGWVSLRGRVYAARGRDLAIMVGLGVILIVYQWFYLAAVDRLGVSIATVITLCVPPVLVALASVALFGEPLTGRALAALAGALAGTGLLVGWQPVGDAGQGPVVAGVVFALGSAAGIAGHVLGSRAIAGRHESIRPLAVAFPVGVVAFAPFIPSRGVSLDLSATAWFWLIYLALIPSVVAYWLYQRGLQDVPATTASIVTLLEPLAAAMLARLIFDERLGVAGVVGGLLLMGSIVVLSVGGKPSKRATEEMALV